MDLCLHLEGFAIGRIPKGAQDRPFRASAPAPQILDALPDCILIPEDKTTRSGTIGDISKIEAEDMASFANTLICHEMGHCLCRESGTIIVFPKSGRCYNSREDGDWVVLLDG